MDKLQLVKFDIRGLNPDNRVLLEKIPILDKTCPWIIPNGTPYFAEDLLVTIYGQTGAKLTLGVDYWFEGEFPPFCEITGRSICSYIRLSERTLTQNKFVSVTYQSIGAWFVPRNNINEWVYEMHQGKTPIPWSKVFNVPPELPSEFHSHSIKTEIGDWYELTFFFDYLANIYSTRNPGLYEDAEQAIADSFQQLISVKNTQLARINSHDMNYADPHGTTKFHLDLGNLDNYATATAAQDLAGVATNLFSTPQGALVISEYHEQDTSSAMQTGILPVSYFGDENYIPPLIAGSFEGLGSLSASTGVCLEDSGMMMVLANHYDGRVNGLYYTTVDRYKSNNPAITFTGFRYNPPDLVNKGIAVNRIISGSGDKAIMVGNAGTNDWYVALTNGTFNPAAHQFVKCDMTNVRSVYGGAIYNVNEEATLFEMGNYLFLMQPAIQGNIERFFFFRVSKADVRNGTPVTWQLRTVSYTDFDGAVFNNVNYLQPYNPQRNASNEFTRVGPWSFRQPATGYTRSGKAQAWACDLDSFPGQSMLHVMSYSVFSRNGIAIDLIGEMGYMFNPETGAMTLNNKPLALNMGFTDSTPSQRQAYLQDYYGPFSKIGRSGMANGTFLPDGTLYIPYVNDRTFPLFMHRSVFPGLSTLESVLIRGLNVQSIGGQAGLKDFPNKVASPILSGPFPCSLMYDNGGEIYSAVESGSNQRKLFYRKVTGGYQVRANVTNLMVGSVRSRPLTNDIYTTNLDPGDPITQMTGTAASLSAAGVESGNISLTACAWSSSAAGNPFPKNPALRAPNQGTAVITFPRSYTRTLNKSARTATYKGDSFYGLRQADLDLIKSYIPAAYRDSTPSWAFTFHMTEPVSGGLFAGPNMVFIAIHYYDMVNGTARTQLVMCSVGAQPPTADNPELSYLINLTALDKPADVIGAKNLSTSAPAFLPNADSLVTPTLSMYRNGTRYICYNTGVFAALGANGDNARMITFFEAEFSASKFSNVAQASFPFNGADQVAFIPGTGLTDINLFYNNPGEVQTTPPAGGPFEFTGGGASIYKKGADYYLLSSTYPETGWVIFFQEKISLMIQGTAYWMPGGFIDLRDVTPDPGNKTFYIYATIEDNIPKYILSTTKLRRGSALLLVGSATTNGSQVISIDRKKPFVIGDYEMSYTRDGGIIPISTGFPQDEGVFRFLKLSELLP